MGYATRFDCINEEKFLLCYKDFIRHPGSCSAQPTLLLLDNQESRVSRAATELSKDNDIGLLIFPPQTPDKLKPLDKSLKVYFNLAVDVWMISLPVNKFYIHDISEFVKESCFSAMTRCNITSDRDTSEIYPCKIASIISSLNLDV